MIHILMIHSYSSQKCMIIIIIIIIMYDYSCTLTSHKTSMSTFVTFFVYSKIWLDHSLIYVTIWVTCSFITSQNLVQQETLTLNQVTVGMGLPTTKQTSVMLEPSSTTSSFWRVWVKRGASGTSNMASTSAGVSFVVSSRTISVVTRDENLEEYVNWSCDERFDNTGKIISWKVSDKCKIMWR